MEQVKIGRFISSLRKEKEMTQSQLAEVMGVSTNAVSKWERGINLPDASIMQKLCDVLGITLNEFFAGERVEETAAVQRSEQNILSLLKLANNKDRKNKILALLVALLFLISLIWVGKELLVKGGYLPDDQLKYSQVYISGNGNIKGEVDIDSFGKISIDFDIGANKYGRAVFKNPKKALRTLKVMYAKGIQAIQTEYRLLPLNPFNFRAYGRYGWQLAHSTAEETQQAGFVSSFMDIYENDFE